MRLPVEPVMLDPNAGAEKQMLEKLNEPELINIVHAPLLRLKLSHDSYSNVWYALFYMHHLIEDATSLKLIFNEMLAQFTPTADALTKPVPYRNFVAHTLHHLYDAEAFSKKLGDITETTAPFGLYDVRGDGRNINSLRCSLLSSFQTRFESGQKRCILAQRVFFTRLVIGCCYL
ncbi:hypothetical protein [Bacillus velezensis]|uniref:hypothetical protein n=1 Tax=Bacillus velezensis TaxID=492670 RepID=UPI0015F60C3B|nr:hypothetical protein [Bacillus velezensis]